MHMSTAQTSFNPSKERYKHDFVYHYYAVVKQVSIPLRNATNSHNRKLEIVIYRGFNPSKERYKQLLSYVYPGSARCFNPSKERYKPDPRYRYEPCYKGFNPSKERYKQIVTSRYLTAN